MLLGAIIGDIVGSTREWNNIKTEAFEAVPRGSRFTDDTVMTLAVAEWLMTDAQHRESTLTACMQRLGRQYPNAGYGGMFSRWLTEENPRPYSSFGNGSAMRVSPVGLFAASLEEAVTIAGTTAAVSHNHPEGIKGAQAVAAAVYLNKQGGDGVKARIKAYVEQTFGYNLGIRLEEIREDYTFDVTCQGSVPVAIMAFLQRSDAYGALRLAISMGGDSDTIGCMTTSIAMACRENQENQAGYMPEGVVAQCRRLLTPDLLDINDRFLAFLGGRRWP
ncbi:MAG: ADP-ribosylglycohydrolase family protein [Prevotellaceae bacterium]|nr:ADP-ribosylglycohydrolase family protein [Prevotellaceae bacterium]